MPPIFHDGRSIELTTFDWEQDRVVDRRAQLSRVAEDRPDDITVVRTVSLLPWRTSFESLAHLLVTTEDELAKIARLHGAQVISHTWGTVTAPPEVSMQSAFTGGLFGRDRGLMGTLHPLVPGAAYLAAEVPIIDETGTPHHWLTEEQTNDYQREGGLLRREEVFANPAVYGRNRQNGEDGLFLLDIEPIYKNH